MAGKQQKIGRDAGNGRFIKVERAIKMGDKAVVETIRKFRGK